MEENNVICYLVEEKNHRRKNAATPRVEVEGKHGGNVSLGVHGFSKKSTEVLKCLSADQKAKSVQKTKCIFVFVRFSEIVLRKCLKYLSAPCAAGSEEDSGTSCAGKPRRKVLDKKSQKISSNLL